jgi:hypothetical protein
VVFFSRKNVCSTEFFCETLAGIMPGNIGAVGNAPEAVAKADFELFSINQKSGSV